MYLKCDFTIFTLKGIAIQYLIGKLGTGVEYCVIYMIVLNVQCVLLCIFTLRDSQRTKSCRRSRGMSTGRWVQYPAAWVT